MNTKKKIIYINNEPDFTVKDFVIWLTVILVVFFAALIFIINI
mgnify:FL=1